MKFFPERICCGRRPAKEESDSLWNWIAGGGAILIAVLLILVFFSRRPLKHTEPSTAPGDHIGRVRQKELLRETGLHVTITVFFIGLVVQLVLWPCLYFLSELHFGSIIRRRRAQGNMSNNGHYGEVIIVFAIISLLCWFLYPAVLWVRSE